MKIGIITQPLKINYGGLLQAYALQKVLREKGHEVYTISRANSFWFGHKGLKFHIIRILRKLTGHSFEPSKKEFERIVSLCRNFVDKNIKITDFIDDHETYVRFIKEQHFNAFIVGSDQVWRPCYSSFIEDDFLQFCKDDQALLRLSYAASFGVDKWEFTPEQTMHCGELAKLFNGISVREESGINLCKEHLGVNASLVLDPTLLLEKEDYISLISNEHSKDFDGEIFCYFLDSNPEKQFLRQKLESVLNTKSFEVRSKRSPYRLDPGVSLDEFTIPSPENWLQAFRDAKMVVTDSFHGCVFSIIFNKPFWVISNKERGNARFDSLLNLFELNARRVSAEDIDKIDFLLPIDWKKVNFKKSEWTDKSMSFLNKYV